jgi:hypothetical protein
MRPTPPINKIQVPQNEGLQLVAGDVQVCWALGVPLQQLWVQAHVVRAGGKQKLPNLQVQTYRLRSTCLSTADGEGTALVSPYRCNC